MKQFLSTAIITSAIISVIAGCEQFSTSYERIEHDELRMLDFIYEPADAAPGDTLTLTAVFAGKTVDLDEHIKNWWISFNVVSDMLGGATVVDSLDLRKIASEYRVGREFSENTQTAVFKIPLPADMMKTGAAIPEAWADMLTASQLAAVPPAFAAMSKNDVIDALASFTPGSAVDNVFLPVLLQYFTVPIRVMARIHEPGIMPHTVRSAHNIRYNSRVNKAVPGRVPVNNNPEIDSIVILKVKGDHTSIQNKTGLTIDTITFVKGQVTEIEIADGYSYFLEAFSDRSKDSTVTMFGNRIQEEHEADWSFHLNKDQIAGVDHTKYMSVSGGFGERRLTPPEDRRIRDFILWAVVTDDAMNERLRPQGSMLGEAVGRFVYK